MEWKISTFNAIMNRYEILKEEYEEAISGEDIFGSVDIQGNNPIENQKIILNEFVAFSHMNDILGDASARTYAVTTFALCGFANLSSIAILLGGLGVLVPERRDLIGQLGLKAVLAGSLSNLMSAALAGLLLTF